MNDSDWWRERTRLQTVADELCARVSELNGQLLYSEKEIKKWRDRAYECGWTEDRDE